MYSKNYSEQKRNYGNPSVKAERQTGTLGGGLPPNYGGVAAYSSYGNGERETKTENTDRDPRFPLMYEGEQNDGYERELGHSEEKKDAPSKREGMLSGLASRNINGEDLLIAALILLLMNSEADSDILLLLGLLLILGA